MLIRYGYEITLTCQQPTALVCLLSVHEDRAADIRNPETTFTTPDVPVSTYLDLFGNRCRRLVAPAGDVTMWATTTLMDLVGPYAWSTDCPLEKFFRDAKIYQLFEGTAEIQRMVISRMQAREYGERLGYAAAVAAEAAAKSGTPPAEPVAA